MDKTDELIHDLDEIATAFIDFKQGKEHPSSEYVFSIKQSDIKDHLNINPRHYSSIFDPSAIKEPSHD